MLTLGESNGLSMSTIWYTGIFPPSKHHESEQFQDDCFPAGILGHTSPPLLQLQYTAM